MFILTKSKKSLVSVVVPVYKGEKFIEETIQSILNQSYKNLELILVNDCSPDKSLSILKKYEKKDKRVKIINNKENVGISNAINIGLTHASGEFLGMSDQDDVSYPERFEKEVNFLEENKDFAMVGSSFDNINDDSKVISSFTPPLTETEFYWWMIFSSPVCAPSVMVRMSFLRKNNIFFRPEFDLTQDYDVWSRVCKHSRGINLKDVLTAYRQHSNQNTNLNFIKQQKKASRVTERELSFYTGNKDFNKKDIEKIRKWKFAPPKNFEISDITALELMNDIAQKYNEYHRCNKEEFLRTLNFWRTKLKEFKENFPKMMFVCFINNKDNIKSVLNNLDKVVGIKTVDVFFIFNKIFKQKAIQKIGSIETNIKVNVLSINEVPKIFNNKNWKYVCMFNDFARLETKFLINFYRNIKETKISNLIIKSAELIERNSTLLNFSLLSSVKINEIFIVEKTNFKQINDIKEFRKQINLLKNEKKTKLCHSPRFKTKTVKKEYKISNIIKRIFYKICT